VTIRGSIDAVTTKGASGWAHEEGRRNDLTVQAILSHEVIGDAAATEHRPDLAAVGLGKGNCGYTIEFYREIDPLYLPFVSIKVDGGDVELPRAGQVGFSEFFTAFYRAHPAAGRPRSMLGGLWTDRTDAAAMLKSKTDIGQISSEVAAVISQLVHDGIAIVAQSAVVPTNGSDDRLTSDRIGALIEDPLTLAALRAVLEDHPLAITAEMVTTLDTRLIQPSAEVDLPSPAECVVVIASVTEQPVAVEIVRNSHHLPEFTPGGISRWSRGQAHAGIEVAVAQQGLMTLYDIASGSAAIIGPGTIYQLRCSNGCEGLKVCCVPARALPLTIASNALHHQNVRTSGTRILTSLDGCRV
jgi:hypothetical protein